LEKGWRITIRKNLKIDLGERSFFYRPMYDEENWKKTIPKKMGSIKVNVELLMAGTEI